MQSCPHFKIEEYTRDVGTAFSQTRHTTSTMRRNNSSLFCCNYPQLHVKVIHPLRMPDLRKNDVSLSYTVPKNTCYESGHHLIVRKQAFKILELLLRVKTCLEYEVRQNVARFNWGKAFGTVFLQRNDERVDANDRYLSTYLLFVFPSSVSP